MARKAYVATIQVMVYGENLSDAGACDAIHSLLSEQECVVDWGYLKLGGQFLYPTARVYDPGTYEEGDFMRE